MGEIGHGRPVEYQPEESDWAAMLRRMDDILRASGQLRDSDRVDVQWNSDELQRRFTLTRKPLMSGTDEGALHYTLSIEDTLSREAGESVIALRDNNQGITALMGPICEEVEAGLSAESMENAELLLRLYLSSYTMDNDV